MGDGDVRGGGPGAAEEPAPGPERKVAATAGGAAATAAPAPGRSGQVGARRLLLIGALFLLPAMVLLGALVLWPIIFSVVRSLYDVRGDQFVGLANYQLMFDRPTTRVALRNNAVWLVAAPFIVTTLGLIFAVLTERVSWGTAFKAIVFMPMAISFLAVGVIFRLVYDHDPGRGIANALLQGVVHVVRPPGDYFGTRPSVEEAVVPRDGGFAAAEAVRPGDTITFGLIGIPPGRLPEGAEPAAEPSPAAGEVRGLVWLDFSPGGQAGAVDPGERGMPRVQVHAVADGRVVARTLTGADGSFALTGLEDRPYEVRLAETSFRAPYGGVQWLGRTLVTPAIILSFTWMWAGFAMVVIGAGLSAIPREVMEAARVDGATEWQVFRRVTVPLLRPVLMVVLVTLAINVLKIFDLVIIIAPGAVQADANVLAVEMWQVAFGANNHALGSAIAVFLFLLVLPAMIFNFRRFRMEG